MNSTSILLGHAIEIRMVSLAFGFDDHRRVSYMVWIGNRKQRIGSRNHYSNVRNYDFIMVRHVKLAGLEYDMI